MFSVYIVFGKLETFLEKENVAMLGSTIGTMKHHRIGKKLINPRLGHNTTLCCTMKHHRIGKKLLNPRLGHNTTLCCLTISDQVPCSIYPIPKATNTEMRGNGVICLLQKNSVRYIDKRKTILC